MRLLAAALAVSLGVSAAHAQNIQCFPYEAIEERLVQNFGEQPQGRGIESRNGFMLTIWANPDTGTFTVTVTRPDDLTCIVSHGSDWGAARLVPMGLEL